MGGNANLFKPGLSTQHLAEHLHLAATRLLTGCSEFHPGEAALTRLSREPWEWQKHQSWKLKYYCWVYDSWLLDRLIYCRLLYSLSLFFHGLKKKKYSEDVTAVFRSAWHGATQYTYKSMISPTAPGLLALILSAGLCCSSKDEAVSNKRYKWHFCKALNSELGISGPPKCRHSDLQLCTRWRQKDSGCWPAILRLLEPAVLVACGVRCPCLGFVSTTGNRWLAQLSR